MADYDLGTAHGTIVVDVDTGAVDTASSKVRKFGDDGKRTTQNSFDFNALANGFDSTGDKIVGVGKKLSLGITAPATIAGGALAAITIGPGLKRLTDIDNAQAKLMGLGHSADETTLIMNNALASVKGTAFGLGDAATVAANAVAAGVKPGADLERTLKLTADAATIAGTSLSDMSDIFGDVETSGKVTGDTLMQLNTRGIPALQLLADSMGVSTDAAQKMVSEGKVGFAQFQDAIEKGMGGAALKSGQTFTGSLDNVQAALGRLGASALSGAFPALTDGFNKLITQLDNLGPTAERMGKALTPVIQAIVDGVISAVKWFSQLSAPMQDLVIGLAGAAVAAGPFLVFIGKIASGVGAMIKFVGFIKDLELASKAAAAAQWLFNIAMDANPIGLIITAIAALVAGLIWFFTQTKLGQEIWKNVTDFLVSAWNATVSFITTTLQNIGNFFTTIWTNISNFVQTVVGAIVGFITGYLNTVQNVWNTVWGAIRDFLTPIFTFIGAFIQTSIQAWQNIFLIFAAVLVTIWNGIVAVVTTVWNAIVAFLTPIVQGISDFIGGVIQGISDVWNTVWGAISSFFTDVWNGMVAFYTPIVQGILDFITGVVNGISSVWNTVWGAISSFFSGIWNGMVAFYTPIVQGILTFISGVVRNIQSTWNSIWGAISSFFSGIWNGMVDAVSGAVNTVFSIVGGIQSKIIGFFTGVGTWLYDTGKNIIQGLINGISGMIQNVINAIGKVVNGAIDWAKKTLGIKSPSTVFAAIGENTVKGMIKGLDNQTPALNKKMTELGNDMSATMNATVSANAAKGTAADTADDGTSKTFIYHAAPNQSLDSEDALFDAMQKSKVVVPGW